LPGYGRGVPAVVHSRLAPLTAELRLVDVAPTCGARVLPGRLWVVVTPTFNRHLVNVARSAAWAGHLRNRWPRQPQSRQRNGIPGLSGPSASRSRLSLPHDSHRMTIVRVFLYPPHASKAKNILATEWMLNQRTHQPQRRRPCLMQTRWPDAPGAPARQGRALAAPAAPRRRSKAATVVRQKAQPRALRSAGVRGVLRAVTRAPETRVRQSGGCAGAHTRS
jgi:hypothetical protein